MVANEFFDPVPHIIVDNFLGSNQYKEILSCIEETLPQFTAGQVFTPAGEQAVVNNFKRNGNIWLDPFDSRIVQVLRNNFFAFRTQIKSLDWTNRMHEVLLSQYVAGDFYDWHTDLGGHCTWNYFVCTEPKQFTGGDFMLSNAQADNKEQTNGKTIEFKNNRLVIFPAQYQHSVTAVAAQFLEPMSSRYSIQVFFR